MTLDPKIEAAAVAIAKLLNERRDWHSIPHLLATGGAVELAVAALTAGKQPAP